MTQWTQRSFRSSGRRRAPTWADLLSIAVLLAASILSAGIFQRGPASAMALVRTVEGDVLLPLGTDVTRDFQGPLGLTRVEVRDGFVRIRESPCHLQLCVRMGQTRSVTRSLVCIPNRVRVRIVGDDSEEALDALAR